MTISRASDIRFETFEGNQLALPFELRRSGIKGTWNVSGATQIKLEVTDLDGTDMAPILADSGHPDADWSNGIVVVVIDGTNVTGAIGTYPFSLTVTIGGQIITAGIGKIEVLDRPGYTP